jgi:uroporphyrinogen decarboxylase
MFDGGPVDHLTRRPFGYFPQTFERWVQEGLPREIAEHEGSPAFNAFFGFDPEVWMGQPMDMGWCEPPLVPAYEEKIVRVEGDYEIVQDVAGRLKRYPKGIRTEVMPNYLKHAVASREDWERDIRPRLDPATPARWDGYEKRAAANRARLERGEVVHTGGGIGGYMYLRSLIGPTEVLLAFYDAPDLIHSMMETWRDLMVACLKRHQADVGPFFRFFLAEDICFKTGPLISPDMIRSFILPYYREVYQELRANQKEPLHFEIDTDGNCVPVVDLYREVGLDAMSPWEVASGCDVVEAGRRWPDLHIRGGIDKRVLAEGPDAIDRMLERILPPMVRRGRYIPCCDHAVPHSVSLANYMHYRKRVQEMDH